MSIIIDNDNFVIHVPNSEASIKAQHVGIKDRSVGQYYLSEKAMLVNSFFNNMSGSFYIDFLRTRENLNPLLNRIIDLNMQNVFKSKLVDQKNSMKSLKWILDSENGFHKIDFPVITASSKYLKFNTVDEYYLVFRDMCLGDFVDIKIVRLSKDCFVMYAYDNGKFDIMYENGELEKWLD